MAQIDRKWQIAYRIWRAVGDWIVKVVPSSHVLTGHAVPSFIAFRAKP
jgi:hypothetical protein